RGRLRGEVEPHAKTFGETKRRPIQRIGRRPGCPPAQDLVDSSGAAKMLRGGHTRKTPPATPPTRHPVARRQVAGLKHTSDQQQLLLRRPRGDLGPVSSMNTLISLRIPNRPGRYIPGSIENPTPGTSGRSSAVSKLSMW